MSVYFHFPDVTPYCVFFPPGNLTQPYQEHPPSCAGMSRIVLPKHNRSLITMLRVSCSHSEFSPDASFEVAQHPRHAGIWCIFEAVVVKAGQRESMAVTTAPYF